MWPGVYDGCCICARVHVCKRPQPDVLCTYVRTFHVQTELFFQVLLRTPCAHSRFLRQYRGFFGRNTDVEIRRIARSTAFDWLSLFMVACL